MQEAPIEQILKPETTADNLSFKHWPGFARFIRENHMTAYAQDLLRLSREADLPIMKLIAHLPEEQLLALTIQGHGEFLEKITANTLREHLNEGLKKWEDNQLEIISSDDIATEDITVGTFIRKKAMLNFLPLYTSDPYEIIEIIREIDVFDTEAITVSTKLHFKILKTKIQEQLHFIEKISNTTPGFSYVFDIEKKHLKYANQNFLDYFGYSLEDIQGLGNEFMNMIFHAEDIVRLNDILGLVPQMSNTDMLKHETRMKGENGRYKWHRHYFSVFKRDGAGKPTEIVGIALDIENEKRASEQLAYREEQLLEAQAIGEIGSFEWTFGSTEKTTVTPQLLKIFSLDSVVDFETFMDYVHPTDRARVQAAIDVAMKEEGIFECEFRYERNNVEKIIWSRGVVSADKDGVPCSMKGTIMDVTERNHMIHRLQRSEELYKQAQALSHIGNYAYDLKHNKINWTDELYRIFGLEPQSEEITNEKFLSFIHSDDRERAEQIVNEAIEQKKSHNFYFRIIRPDGTERILQAIGEVLVDENGVVYKFLGTAQDVTEKQLLINNLQQAQSMAHIGNWTWDLASDEIIWSEEMFHIYKLEPRTGKLKRDEYTYLRHPEDIETIDTNIQKLLETLEPQEYHFRAVLADGNVRHLHVRAEVKTDSEGKPVQLFGTLQDITERQEIITRLQNSDALYKQAQAMSHIGNWTWDRSTNEVIWSEETYRIYDVPYNENEKLSLEFARSFRHPDDRAYVAEMIDKVLSTGQRCEYQYRIVTETGKTKILNAITEPLTDSTGKAQKVIGTVQDITDKVLIERQVKANEEFIKKIADTAPSIITTYNINTGQYNFVSEGITKLLGYDAAMILKEGVSFFMERMHPDDIEEILTKNSAVLEQANTPGNEDAIIVEEFKYRVRDFNGRYRWLHTYGTVFDRDAEGKVEHVLNVSVDITEQVEAELALQQRNIQLQQSNSSLEDYAYVASHDLKEPLRKIATFSDRLLSTHVNELSEDGKLYLSKIIDSSKRMQNMISDLLAVSTISGNKSFEPYSLQKALTEAMQTIEHKIEEKKAIINTTTLPVASIVPSQFRQLFQNLISNSLKFSRKDIQPEINITATYLKPEETERFVNLTNAERYLQITYTDNGIGFDNSYAEKIFSIFQRLHNRSEYEGTGIGLAICRKVAENHGGLINASGESGRGATFNIIIPT